MAYFLGIDVGTQGSKALVLDDEGGQVVARASRSYDLIEGLPAGHAEQHPDTWISALGELGQELAGQVDLGRVEAVGVSGQQHGLVVLDGEDRVVRPAKLWCDTATSAEAQELTEALGRAVPTGFTASKITWLARHEPEHWGQVRTVLLPHDYVNFRLTGVRSMEAGDASGTGFFDVAGRCFDEGAVEAVDPRLGGCLPPLVEQGTVQGLVHAEGAELLGVRAGIPVSTGGGDNMMSAVGSGATSPGTVVVSLGTSGTVFTHAEAPVVDPEGLIAPFCGSTGGWLPLLCVMNLTGVAEEVARSSGLDHDELTRRAAQVEPGCGGLMWLPYLSGERVPDLPAATGTLLGMRPGHLDPGVLYRAALEGTSLNLAWGVDRLRGLGIGVEAVNLVGGAARNPLWRSILASCLEAPVTPLAEPESAALGAGLHALWTHARAAGDGRGIHELARAWVTPGDEPTRPEHAGLYRELQASFRESVGRLYPS